MEVETDEATGVCTHSESYGGLEVMKVKQEQVYLGHVISTDGKHTKNVMARENKGLGGHYTNNANIRLCVIWEVFL